MKRKLTKEKGFTLIELVISCTVGIMLIGIILFSGVHMQRNLEMNSTRMEILSDVRLISDWIIKDIKFAAQVEISETVLGQLYTTGTNQLVLSVPTVDASGEVVDSTFDHIAYYVNGNNLVRVYDADVASRREDQTKTISQNISIFRLASDGTLLSSIADVTALEKVTVFIEVSKQILSQNLTDTIQSTIRLRNKIT